MINPEVGELARYGIRINDTDRGPVLVSVLFPDGGYSLSELLTLSRIYTIAAELEIEMDSDNAYAIMDWIGWDRTNHIVAIVSLYTLHEFVQIYRDVQK